MPKKNTLDIADALQEFYPPFAGYVIQSRALPDSRDGLKRGARQLLYAQYADKITYNRKRQKSNASVASAMRFNPHGDAPVYENLVRLSQPFSMRYPLQDPHGNFGGLAGLPPAASRYTEVRSSKIAHEMTKLLQKNTVEWIDNYTQTEKYPTVFPSVFPNSLVNGN